ncbi:MAG: glycosyltransferase family 39 protein [Verrucomicrobia bacterium]|nr:glycosyltransferase family 39 protein [Verrucomicrobiota bacterium]
MGSDADSGWNADVRRVSLGLTVGVALLALFWQLGARGLNEPDEGRYASVAVEMIRSGNWLVPHFQGSVHLSKPPLTYWLIALSFKLFGVNEWAARLPSALAALGIVLMIWSLAARWFGPRGAFQTALILITAPLFFAVARLADPNMLLTFCVTTGVWAWIGWQEEGRPLYRWLCYAAHGAAFLIKGPVGCVLILIAVLSFRWLGGGRWSRRPTGSVAGWVLAVGMGLSWYLFMISRYPETLNYFLGYELYDRVFTTVQNRGQPFWFFWWVLPVGFLPWLPVLAPLVRRARILLRPGGPEMPLGVFVILALLLFSVSRSKLITYVLPLYPSLALLTGAQLHFERHAGLRPRRLPMILFAMLSIAAPALLLGLVGRRYQWAPVLSWTVFPAILAALGTLGFMFRERDRNWIVPAALLVLVGHALVLDTIGRHEDNMGSQSSARLLARHVREVVDRQPGPVAVVRAPAALQFYLPDKPPPKPFPVEGIDQVRYLRRQVKQSHLYVVVPVRDFLLFPPLTNLDTRVVYQDRRHIALDVQ